MIKAAVFINNRYPSRALYNFKTPFKALTGNVTEISQIRRVSCRTYKLIPKRKFLKKYDKRAYLRVLVSFKGENLFRLQDPISSKIKRAKEVLFNKDVRLDYTTIDFKLPNSSTNLNTRDAPKMIIPNETSTIQY